MKLLVIFKGKDGRNDSTEVTVDSKPTKRTLLAKVREKKGATTILNNKVIIE